MNAYEKEGWVNEDIYIEHQGIRTGPLKAMFGDSTFTIFNEDISVKEGDVLIRMLNLDKSERYEVRLVQFIKAMDRDIPAHFDLTVRKILG